MSEQSDKCPLVAKFCEETMGEAPVVLYNRTENNYLCRFNSGFSCILTADLVNKMVSQEAPVTPAKEEAPVTPAKEDIIGHPNHYCSGRKYEPKDVIRDWNLNFNLGNAVKYISRNGRKDGNSALQDLKKARQYLDFEIDFLEKEEK